MATDLPPVADEYFAAANAFDVDRTVTLFADDALVKDEGKDIRGREAIREWAERIIAPLEVTA